MTERQLLGAVAAGIRRCRKRLGITIEELAEAAGIDAGYLAHIELGRKAPSMAVLAKILTGLEARPQDLFRGGDARLSEDEAMQRRFRALVRGLNAEETADLTAVLKKLSGPKQLKGLRLLLRA